MNQVDNGNRSISGILHIGSEVDVWPEQGRRVIAGGLLHRES
jgi:hypothetical protein